MFQGDCIEVGLQNAKCKILQSAIAKSQIIEGKVKKQLRCPLVRFFQKIKISGVCILIVMSNVTNCTNLAVAGNFASAGNSTVTNLGVSGTLTVNSLAISGTFTQTNISISGNFTQTGTGSFSTGTGPAYLNGSSTLINNGKLLINNSTPNSYWKEIYSTDDVL